MKNLNKEDNMKNLNKEDKMKKVILLSCCKEKTPYKEKAKDFYLSDNFVKALLYARQHCEDKDIYVLSAKYGLVPLDMELEPYDMVLFNFSEEELNNWGNKVITAIKSKYDISNTIFEILCVRGYFQPLLKDLINVELPFDNLDSNQRNEWLNNHL